MDEPFRANQVMARMVRGSEEPVEDYMLSVVMGRDGRAQAQLRNKQGDLVAETGPIGPHGSAPAIES